MDAANVDLKAFTEDFYYKLTGAHLQPILDTLVYLKHETKVWFELTTLIIPGHNDSAAEMRRMSEWVVKELGPDVPLHFTAFHPDHKMIDVPPTPPATLERARHIALEAGMHHVYCGNVHDIEGDTTFCASCKKPLIVRDWYEIRAYELNDDANCPHCGSKLAGHFEKFRGQFGRQRIPVSLGRS
jgi:pyruvate formate lyase activating enzyme